MSDHFRSSRRGFLRCAGLTLAGLRLHAGIAAPETPAALDPSTLTPFVDPLPLPALARAEGVRANPENPGASIPYYRIPMREVRVKVHRDLPATRMWSFGESFPGPTIETQSGKAVIVDWENQLPARHFLPIDHT